MNKCINDELYDTETAMLIDEIGYTQPQNFYFFYEALYKTDAGEFFLYLENGPRTKDLFIEDNDKLAPGWDIEPITPEKAHFWLIQNNRLWNE